MLGGRIGFVFLVALIFLIFIAYFVLSHNFQSLLTDYTIKIVQSMVNQGVTTVEYELWAGQKEVAVLADSFTVPAEEGQGVAFPAAFSQSDILRMVYVSDKGSVASDGRQIDLHERKDILTAFGGETATYGPYFNEENEYVVCYSAPIHQDGKVVGVLSIEKDGYDFCDIIKDIRFANSGESYIINAEGTDIAVSRMDHIDWVNDQYNARRKLESEWDSVTLSIMELEEKGLAGETGVGTYYWEGSLCYVAYAPVPSVHWVLLAGLRQEEIDTMTQSVLFNSITKGPALGIMIVIFIALTGLIIFWIVSSMKKTAELNDKLSIIANYDALTGTLNRNSYHTRLEELSRTKYTSLACIYIDVNGLHEVNNRLGHSAGDLMLKTVADTLHHVFSHQDIYRIGGDEFVVFCLDRKEQDVIDKMQAIRQTLKGHGYEISAGIDWRDVNVSVMTMINVAEAAMQKDKQRYYQENGIERRTRALDQKFEQMISGKQDADAFLSVLSPEFKGVYFVDLGLDTIRHLFIPSYFEEILKEAGDIFSKALRLYIHRIVDAQYRESFEKFCDYSYVEDQLKKHNTLEFTYQKTDGTQLKLRILKFKTYNEQCKETLWIFSNMEK